MSSKRQKVARNFASDFASDCDSYNDVLEQATKFADSDQSREAARYLSTMLDELSHIASSNRLEFVGYLMNIARQEALRYCETIDKRPN